MAAFPTVPHSDESSWETTLFELGSSGDVDAGDCAKTAGDDR